MTHEQTITAAIVGELIPELRYAAPVLLERFDRGDPLIVTTPPTDVGFEGGAVDSVLLEFFKSLVPYVKTALGWGTLGVLQAWQLSRRSLSTQTELVAALTREIDQNATLQEAIENMARLLARMDNAPVSASEVVESIVAAIDRISGTDARPRA